MAEENEQKRVRMEADVRHKLEVKEAMNAKAQIDLGHQMVQKA